MHWAPGFPCALCLLGQRIHANLGHIVPRERGGSLEERHHLHLEIAIDQRLPLVAAIGSGAGKPDRQIPGNLRHFMRLIGSQGEGGCYEWFDLSGWPDRGDHGHPFVFRPSVGPVK